MIPVLSLSQIGQYMARLEVGPRALPRITCALCQKPIDRVLWFRDERTCEQVYRLECHGLYEIFRVEDCLLEAASDVIAVDYVAFRPKR